MNCKTINLQLLHSKRLIIGLKEPHLNYIYFMLMLSRYYGLLDSIAH